MIAPASFVVTPFDPTASVRLAPLRPFAQPIFDRTGACIAHELLIRPTTEQGSAEGYYSRVAALPLPLRLECELRALRMALAGSLMVGGVCSVNVSYPLLLSDAGMAELLTACAARRGTGKTLVVELLEYDDCSPALAAREVSDLLDAGAHIALDDFGHGRAPLAMLAALPAVQWIKFDASIVHSPRAHAVLSAAAVLATSLGAASVAEFVNTRAAHQMTLGCGVDAFQGFYLAEPFPLVL